MTKLPITESDTIHAAQAAGFCEQIQLDSVALAREKAKDNPDSEVITRLAAHVQLCKQRLAA